MRENYLAEKEEIIGDLHWKASGWVVAVLLQLCPQTKVHFSTPTPKILSIAHASPLDSLALICRRRPGGAGGAAGGGGGGGGGGRRAGGRPASAGAPGRGDGCGRGTRWGRFDDGESILSRTKN